MEDLCVRWELVLGRAAAIQERRVSNRWLGESNVEEGIDGRRGALGGFDDALGDEGVSAGGGRGSVDVKGGAREREMVSSMDAKEEGIALVDRNQRQGLTTLSPRRD